MKFQPVDAANIYTTAVASNEQLLIQLQNNEVPASGSASVCRLYACVITSYSSVGGRRGQGSAANDPDNFGLTKPWSWMAKDSCA